MSAVRAVLDSGWTVLGGTAAWLLFLAPFFLGRHRRRPAETRERSRLWKERR
jgi:hypothetical protein